MAIVDVTNNPANIRKGSRWLGSCGSYKGFTKFKSIEFGVRALLVLLRTYRFKYRLLSVRQIITRFAPPSENNTRFYIGYVSGFVGINSEFIVSDVQMPLVALAIMNFELSSEKVRKLGIDLPYVLDVQSKYRISYGNN